MSSETDTTPGEAAERTIEAPAIVARLKRLSHDLRTPLNGIIGFAELIHDGKAGPVTAQQREFLGDIMASARQLLALVHEALDAPRLAAAVARPAPATPSAASEPAPAPAPSAAAQGAAPTILVVDDEAADRTWLSEILTGAGYAVEFAATGAEAIARCNERRFDGVTLDLMLPDMTGWDVVRGIRDSERNAQTPAIVVSLVPHKVAVSGFVVRDVLAKPVASADLLAALDRASVPPGGARPVLIVDNNPVILRLAEAILTRQGYRTVCHRDGESALRAAAETPPVAVLLDLLMPGMDGFEFLARFRETPAGRDVPVIVWTAKDLEPAERERLLGLAQAVVEKRHGGPDGLLEALRAWVPPSGGAGA